MTARGDKKQTEKALTMVKNTLWGIVLALGSYALLWAINPNLVQLGTLNLGKKIQEETLVIDEQDLIQNDIPDPGISPGATAPPGASGPGSGEPGRSNVPYYNQAQAPWGPIPNPRTGTTVRAGGCGITSYAMIAKYYGKNVTPLDVFNLNGRDNTTDFNKFKRMSQLGLNFKMINNFTEADQLIKGGKPIILRTGHPKFTSALHFIVITGFDGNNYLINDPGHRANTTATREEITNEAKYYVYLYP